LHNFMKPEDFEADPSTAETFGTSSLQLVACESQRDEPHRIVSI